jgi:cysteine desulfurase
VLRAIGLTEAQARGSVRIGFGRYTTPAELEEGARAINEAAAAQATP